MKHFLWTNVTNDKQSTVQNGQEFVCQQTNEAYLQSYESACRQYDEQNKKARKKASPVSFLFTIIEIIFIAGILILIKVLYNTSDNEDITILSMIGIMVAFTVITAMYPRFKSKRVKKAGDSNEYQYAKAKRLAALQAIMDDLRAPQDAFDVDLLIFSYKEKGEKVSKNPLKAAALVPFRLWSDDDKVYLADKTTKYCFEKSGFNCIKKNYNSTKIYFADKYTEYNSLDQTRCVIYYEGTYSVICSYMVYYDDGTKQTCIHITQFGLESFEKATGLVFKEDLARTKPWRIK